MSPTNHPLITEAKVAEGLGFLETAERLYSLALAQVGTPEERRYCESRLRWLRRELEGPKVGTK